MNNNNSFKQQINDRFSSDRKILVQKFGENSPQLEWWTKGWAGCATIIASFLSEIAIKQSKSNNSEVTNSKPKP